MRIARKSRADLRTEQALLIRIYSMTPSKMKWKNGKKKSGRTSYGFRFVKWCRRSIATIKIRYSRILHSLLLFNKCRSKHLLIVITCFD